MQSERRLERGGLQPAACTTVLRTFSGPKAEELAVLCRPTGQQEDAAAQAGDSYRALAELLAARRSSCRDLVVETLFLRDIRADLPHVLEVRRRVLAEYGADTAAPLPAFIQQAPVEPHARFELTASAVIPRHPEARSVRDIRVESSCACAGCAQSGGRLVRLGGQATLRTTNIYGTGNTVYDQVRDVFCTAEHLLQQCGMGFADVFRTWIHLRDIDRDYDALNRARREFFHERGIVLRPASTGVQGMPLTDLHAVSLSLEAIRGPRGIDVTRMSTPSLNEAWSYGADFSRGLRLAESNKVTLHVSGTASIDETGRSIHVGDFESQAARMLENIETLLTQQGAGFKDLISGITYLKDPDDAPVLRAMYRERGFDNFPCALVEAPLCRPELLCETEAIALLPRAAAGA